MATRPITDFWICARPKVKYYGAYPAGFLERARNVLSGGRIDDSIWHIPGGMAHKYNGAGGMPLSGYGPNDMRIDLNTDTLPDICMDVRMLSKINVVENLVRFMDIEPYGDQMLERPHAIIIDLPYTEKDADEYPPGREKFPNLNDTLRECLRIITPGGLVGVIDYKWPNGSKVGGKNIYAVAVSTGEGANIRIFTVWRKV